MTSRKRPVPRRRRPAPSADAAVHIVLNGEPTEIRGIPAATTVLDWLREHAELRGTKEGCAEGDCGACTVVVERLGRDSALSREPINACLTSIGQLHGLGLRTVEGLAPAQGPLHPVQAAFAEGGGTQCGFCTPGFVMSAYAFAAGGEAPETGRIHDALAGNLCRCTGYRAIVDAMAKAASAAADPLAEAQPRLVGALKRHAPRRGARFEQTGRSFHVPAALPEALALRAAHPDAVVLAGGTDVGLRLSRQREPIAEIIHVGRLPALMAATEDKRRIMLGAAVTVARALDLLSPHFPHLGPYLTRFGSRQIRNLGTLGGNIGTASPIGDFLPVLLALDATIKLRSAARGARDIPAGRFFRAYRRTELAKDELIESVAIPKPTTTDILFADKISKRYDQDISTVCGAFRLRIEDGLIRDVRLAFGGMAATPKRARAAEATLTGQRVDRAVFAAAADSLAGEFAPISDWRGGAEYRRAVARNLLQRLYLRLAMPAAPLDVYAL